MQLVYSQAILTLTTFDPFDGWNYQYADHNGVLKVNHRATAVGLLATLTATNRQLMQESNVPAGGTAGQTPTDFNAPPIIERIKKGERISMRYRNPTGGTITIDGVADFR